jgi:hypothetical protein
LTPPEPAFIRSLLMGSDGEVILVKTFGSSPTEREPRERHPLVFAPVPISREASMEAEVPP